MAVIADAVRREPLAGFREQDVLLQRAPGARHAGLRVDDDVVGLDQLVREERHQRQLRRRGVAARIGAETRRRDLLPVELGQAVDGLLLQFWCMVLVTIPFCVGGRVGESKVR